MKVLMVIAAILILSAGTALGFSGIRNDWLATYPDVCQTLLDAAADCSLCHGSGFSLNPYGLDLNDNDINFAAIEGIDSDGDGNLNGAEINGCALPGDATSVSSDESTWGGVKTLYR